MRRSLSVLGVVLSLSLFINPAYVQAGEVQESENSQYVQAQLQLSLSLAAVLISTDCYFTLIASYFLFRNDVTIWKVIAAIIGFMGCAVLVGVFDENLDDIDFIGVIIGIGAAIAGTFYAVGLKFVVPLFSPFSVHKSGSVPT